METGLSEESLDFVRGIQTSSLQMGRLIDDVLDFARGRLGGGMVLAKNRVDDLTPFIQEVITELGRAHRGRPVHFTSSPGLSAMVEEGRFRQALSNLIGNALQHSPATESVTVKADVESGIIRIAISNGGPAMSDETLGNLFQPFHRDSTKTKRAGLGLGLYIASEIVRAHGGNIQVTSDVAGTTFTIFIPAA